jgi:hypothetical protein
MLTGNRLVDNHSREVQPKLANIGGAWANLDAALSNLTSGGDEVSASLRCGSTATQSNLNLRYGFINLVKII